MKPLRSLTIMFVAATGLFVTPPAMAAANDDAGKYVQDIGSKALAVIGNKSYGKQQKQAELEKIFGNAVDFNWVGRFVMGRFWKQATDDQKTQYQTQYQKFLLLNYTSRFANYSSGSFKVSSSRDDGDNEYTVSTQMTAGDVSNGEPVLVDYRIRKMDGSYKIFDVTVEGVSLLTTQRSEFASVINNKGIDYLIKQLAEKSAAGANSDK